MHMYYMYVIWIMITPLYRISQNHATPTTCISTRAKASYLCKSYFVSPVGEWPNRPTDRPDRRDFTTSTPKPRSPRTKVESPLSRSWKISSILRCPRATFCAVNKSVENVIIKWAKFTSSRHKYVHHISTIYFITMYSEAVRTLVW